MRDPPSRRGIFWQQVYRVALMPGLPIALLVLLSIVLVLVSRHTYR